MNEKRETIFVKDMLHGRNFTCDSVVELAKKEAAGEKELIERQNSEAIADLRRQLAPKIAEAKKLCR